MAYRVALAATATLVVGAASSNTPAPNDKCTLCEELVKAVVPKAVQECDQLCKKTPFDSQCEQLCALAQAQITPEKICKAVGLCSGVQLNELPIPPNVEKEIEKLVCEAVKDEVPEDRFVSTTCEDVKKKIPSLPEQLCEEEVKQIYEYVIAKCPKSSNSSVVGLPIPPNVVKEIEKLVCQAVKDEVPEQTFASTTCEDVKKKIPSLPEQLCEEEVKNIYEYVIATCPKSSSSSVELPIPPNVVKEIEKLVCQAVKDEVPEQKFASTTCEDVKKKIPSLPEQLCEEEVKNIYEYVIATCPKSSSSIVV